MEQEHFSFFIYEIEALAGWSVVDTCTDPRVMHEAKQNGDDDGKLSKMVISLNNNDIGTKRGELVERE